MTTQDDTATQRRLTALHIGNFKAFADTQRIPLKPITLIFGPNSAGKSSFIHSLALAHEAQFGRDKRGMARLDVHHTDIGGNSIDLGGFRQFVHRGQASKRVVWGAMLQAASLDARLRELLRDTRQISVTLMIGMELDDQDRPKTGSSPRVDAVEIAADGEELLHMSHRRNDERGAVLRLDRLTTGHAVFRRIVGAIVESFTTAQAVHDDDIASANDALATLLPELQVRISQFFPDGVELPDKEETHPLSGGLLPVSKGNRREDIAQAVRTFLPRVLNDLLKQLSQSLADDLKRLQYLGPLRSFPPRHLAFAEHEDSNWYSGGGYAWDLVRRDDSVRASVNAWLGSDKLKTPYELVVRSLVALDQLQEPIESGVERINDEGLSIKHEPPEDVYPIINDTTQSGEWVKNAIEESDADRIRELVLVDKRSNTVVTHRDVGIGISQVLPVLVMAFGSEGKLLAMEQPEIHLHPALQAELADVFIESALGKRKNTFILETHSEHLILRLMRRIREEKLRPDDVCVLFVEPTDRGSRFVELRIDEDGDFIDEWPGGFFEESFHEKFAGR
jgi:hypothetical protein